MAARIEIARTPNPDALMFRVPGRLTTRTHEFNEGDDTGGAPLAARLFDLEGVQMVLIAPEFVTVERKPDHDWDALGTAVHDTLRDFLDSYEMAVVEGPAPQATEPATELEKRIVAVLDDFVRPAVAQDGGEVHYVGFDDGVVRLALRGACGTCPSAMTTLRMGVERLMKEQVPEVRAVENIAQPA